MSPEQWEQWTTHRVALMKDLLELKYNQCREFKEALIPWVLFVEATPDDFWAAGAMKYQLKGKRAHQIQGRNALGNLLTELARAGTLISA